MQYRSPYAPMTEEERMLKAIQKTRNPYTAPMVTMESQVRDATANLDPSKIPRAKTLEEKMMLPPEQDFSEAEGRLANQRAYANSLRGQALPEGQRVGPSNIYVRNPWDSLEVGFNRALGGYLTGKNKKASEKLGEDKKAAGLKRAKAEARMKADAERQRRSESDRDYNLEAGRNIESAVFTGPDGNAVQGFIKEGRAFGNDGKPLPEGFVQTMQNTGNRYHIATIKDSRGNDVVSRTDRNDPNAAPEYFLPSEGNQEGRWTNSMSALRGEEQVDQEVAETTGTTEAKTFVESNQQKIDSIGEKNADLAKLGGFYKQAFDALDNNAYTGPIVNKLPTIRGATSVLEAIQKEAGIAKISEASFGQLSNAEGEWIREAAIPLTLRPENLREYITYKAEGVQRLRKANEYEKAIRREAGRMSPEARSEALNQMDKDIEEILYGGGYSFDDEKFE